MFASTCPVVSSATDLARATAVAAVLLVALGTHVRSSCAQAAQPDERFAERRAAVMDALPDGVLLLHARSEIKRYRESGFHQEPNFFYFAGIPHVTNAILAIDGINRTSTLFVHGGSGGRAALAHTTMTPGDESEAATGIDAVVDWNSFPEFIDGLADATLYVPGALGGSSSSPQGMAPVSDPDVLWLHAIGLRWPTSRIETAADIIARLRAVKDPQEIAALRRSGRASADAFKAALEYIEPGARQRTAEAAVVAACLNNGGDGIGFWPWVMSGPNSVFPMPFASFGDYRHLDRTMQSGELVRVDIGCEADYYQGDVGRTVPVSGRFTDGQREAWELLVTAYHAGLEVMADGVSWADVEAAARAAVEAVIGDEDAAPETDLGRAAAEVLLSDAVEWHQHAVGLWASEPAVPVLRAGMVIAFEPMFALDGQGYYLEDMIAITADGAEVLTPGLPYSAAEIERLMARP